MKRFIPFCFAFILITFSSNVIAELKVIYPNVNGEGKKLFGYAALKLALENSGVDFKLQVSKEKVNNARIREMIKQKKFSVSDFGTSAEFEKELLPVFFPIDLGLNGWRIFIIHKDNQSQFDKITTIEDLRKKEAGQGIGWSDTEILENAGLKVQQAPNLDNLFKMIEKKRFDYFPLGANEANYLLEIYKERFPKLIPNLIIERKILLIYPFGRLFFVHKDNKELHDAIKTGLVKSFENGSFWKLFKSHESHRYLFTKANLKSRTQILIDNPNMTKEFKKIPKKYFFTLNMLD